MKTFQTPLSLALIVSTSIAWAECAAPEIGTAMDGQIARVDGRWDADITLTRTAEARIRVQVHDGRGTDFETDLSLSDEALSFQLNFGRRDFVCQENGSFFAVWDSERNGQIVPYQAGFMPIDGRDFTGF